MQFLLVLAFVTLFLLLPVMSSGVADRLASKTTETYLSPPLWFVGAYERLTDGALLNERLRHRLTMSLWPSNLEEGARQQYLGIRPVLDRLAAIAPAALAAAFLAALALYILEHFRFGRRLAEGLVVGAQPPGTARRFLSWCARLLVVRGPPSQAIFFFTLQTLARSARNRLYLAGYLAAGFALALVSLARAGSEGSGMKIIEVPRTDLLAIQLILSFSLCAGLRAVLAVPSELKANWVFRLTEAGKMRQYATGARRALETGLVVPFVLLFVPLHALLWGWRVAAYHAVVGVLVSLVLVEAFLVHFDKIPFTSSYTAGKANLKVMWPFYLAGFLATTYLVAYLEERALLGGLPWGILLVALGAVVSLLKLYRTVRSRHAFPMVFEDDPDTAVQLRLEA